MTQANRIDVYIEGRAKRLIASAVQWPGWTRSGRNEESALQALFDCAPRYARALQHSGLKFQPPADLADLVVVEWLAGDATTDFGAPSIISTADLASVDETELAQMQKVLEACWEALDAAAERAAGKELRKGPRGGGRSLEAMLRHVLEAEQAYLGQIGRTFRMDNTTSLPEMQARMHEAVINGLVQGVRDGIPSVGPRGGSRWTARYFARKVAWHTLDHAWEIEDRIQ